MTRFDRQLILLAASLAVYAIALFGYLLPELLRPALGA